MQDYLRFKLALERECWIPAWQWTRKHIVIEALAVVATIVATAILDWPHIMTAIAVGGITILVLFVLTISGFAVSAPYRLWKKQCKYIKSFQVEQRIHAAWRFNDGKAEFILTNNGYKSINGVSVTLRNYRRADGTPGKDIMYDMPTTDGREPPLELYPRDPTYFRFAGLQKAETGNTIIVLLPNTDRVLQVGTEVGVKLGFRGTDLLAQPIILRLKVSDSGLSIEPWDEEKKAVGEGGIEA